MSKQKRKFYRTTFTFDVLSEEPLGDDLSLSQIDYEISEGDCVGGNLRSQQVELTGKAAADALYELGSEPGFFMLNDKGQPVELEECDCPPGKCEAEDPCT